MISQPNVYNVRYTKTVCMYLQCNVLNMKSSHCDIQISIVSILTCNGFCPHIM